MSAIDIVIMEVDPSSVPAEPTCMVSVNIDGDHVLGMELLEHIEGFASPGRKMVIK